jgi:hypothetical protein
MLNQCRTFRLTMVWKERQMFPEVLKIALAVVVHVQWLQGVFLNRNTEFDW